MNVETPQHNFKSHYSVFMWQILQLDVVQWGKFQILPITYDHLEELPAEVSWRRKEAQSNGSLTSESNGNLTSAQELL